MKTLVTTLSKVAFILLVGASLYFTVGHFTTKAATPPNDTLPANAMSTPTPVVETMLTLINEQRAKVGKPALVEDPKLDTAAASKVAAMIQYQTYTHQMPNGEPVFKYLGQQYRYWTDAGENLVECAKNNTDAVGSWVHSPGHYAIMTGNYDAFGYATSLDPRTHCNVTASYYIKYYR